LLVFTGNGDCSEQGEQDCGTELDRHLSFWLLRTGSIVVN
jgi:hypothetical protein